MRGPWDNETQLLNHHFKGSCCTSEIYHFGWRDQTFDGLVKSLEKTCKQLCSAEVHFVVVKRCYKFIVRTMVYSDTGSWRWKEFIHHYFFWCPIPSSISKVIWTHGQHGGLPGVGRHSRSPGALEGKPNIPVSGSWWSHWWSQSYSSILLEKVRWSPPAMYKNLS